MVRPSALQIGFSTYTPLLVAESSSVRGAPVSARTSISDPPRKLLVNAIRFPFGDQPAHEPKEDLRTAFPHDPFAIFRTTPTPPGTPNTLNASARPSGDQFACASCTAGVDVTCTTGPPSSGMM